METCLLWRNACAEWSVKVNISLSNLKLPQIRRKRAISGGNGAEVSIAELKKFLDSYKNTPCKAGTPQVRLMERRVSNANNRIEIAEYLFGALKSPNIVYIALRFISEILRKESPENARAVALEHKFKDCVERMLQNETAKDLMLLQELAETPGKLLWSGVDRILWDVFRDHISDGFAQSILNALGKCGEASRENIERLGNVLSKSQLSSHREKAAWAMGRLLSPYQPEE